MRVFLKELKHLWVKYRNKLYFNGLIKYIYNIMETGKISSQDLMQKLVNAKKVMNKVEGGNYQTGNVNTDVLFSNPEQVAENYNMQQNPTRNVTAPANSDRIANSKLPDAIKKAMMENPIPQISLNESIDMDFVKGAKRLMEQEGISTKQPQQTRQNQQSANIDMNAIAVLIENTVRKVMDEKLNQILTAQQTQSINENLVLKVGDSVFKGKITGVGKSK
jgi:hypothetical protein